MLGLVTKQFQIARIGSLCAAAPSLKKKKNRKREGAAVHRLPHWRPLVFDTWYGATAV